MPTIDDALELARKFTARDSARTGKRFRGFVREFEYGWAIWTAYPEGEVPPIGAGHMTVLDRETGQLSHWPPWTIETLTHAYATFRESPRQSSQQLPRTNIRLPEAPAAFFMLRNRCTLTAPDGRTWWQFNALADDLPEHHPLVTQWLAGLHAADCVRGAERHSLMWLISDVLQDLDPSELAGCRLNTLMPCATCAAACVHFGLSDPAVLEAFAPRPGELEPGSGTLPDGSPFDATVWPDIIFQILESGQDQGDFFAAPIPRVEAARPILERFPVATSARRGPGLETYIQPFHLGVTHLVKNVGRLFSSFGALIGAGVYPLGEVDPRGRIAVDEHGRLFVLDEGGAWYCGRDIDTALRMLLDGLRMPRVRADGSVSF